MQCLWSSLDEKITIFATVEFPEIWDLSSSFYFLLVIILHLGSWIDVSSRKVLTFYTSKTTLNYFF